MKTVLGKRIRELRSKKGFSQESFADHCGLHRTYMGGIERGEHTLTIETVMTISGGLAMTMSELLAGVPFHFKISGQGFRYCPVTLSAALWQRFAAEVAGLIHPVRCAAPNCARWFLRGAIARSDKRFCSNACKNRAFRRSQKPQKIAASMWPKFGLNDPP